MIFTSFQGARFYPNIFGKSRFGVNETRRVTLSASILEGLGLVTRHDDPLGGVTWSGRDLFEMFDKSQCKLHALKRAFIALEPLENISQEDISFAMEAADKFNLASTEAPIISTDGLSSEQQRTVHNQNIFCKCGFIKKMEIEDAKKGKSVKRSVHVGTKRRTRCKECPGCKATKCNECQHCLKPQNKKPCVLRVCHFPKVPKCPCFAWNRVRQKKQQNWTKSEASFLYTVFQGCEIFKICTKGLLYCVRLYSCTNNREYAEKFDANQYVKSTRESFVS